MCKRRKKGNKHLSSTTQTSLNHVIHSSENKLNKRTHRLNLKVIWNHFLCLIVLEPMGPNKSRHNGQSGENIKSFCPCLMSFPRSLSHFKFICFFSRQMLLLTKTLIFVDLLFFLEVVTHLATFTHILIY